MGHGHEHKQVPASAHSRRGLSCANELFPVVGIGASAGGLEAFTQLLSQLPAETGMAFVLVQHLDPTQASHLSELLGRKTPVPVVEVTDGLAVEPDHVYVIPPNTAMVLEHGTLKLTPRTAERGLHLPIDHFFRSLAAERKSQAIGVVLSGTGSDGSDGLREIKGAGGITFAQDEQSAAFAAMPVSAISRGSVDFVLPPAAIAEELARIGRHAYMQPRPPAAGREPEDYEAEGGPDEGDHAASAAAQEDLRPILALLRKGHDIDLSGYRDSTIRRRIARRMALRRVDSAADYARVLEQDRPELNALYRDVLINVTRFFRDPEVFEALKTAVFPELIKNKSPEVPIRIWVPGCSTGEEAHSLAIVLLEFLDQLTMRPPVQIFATDICDPKVIEQARAGRYPETIAADVSPERLHRFFTHDQAEYRIGKAVRDMVVFARQNVVADPPFSRMDLISCRNLLIYLSNRLQQRVLPLFHYALNPGGFLLLGSSEAVGRFTDLFTAVDTRQRIFQRNAAVARLGAYPPLEPFGSRIGMVGRFPAERALNAADLQKEADRIVLGRYAPAGVLVNAELEVLQFRGHTRHYLEPPPGEATFNLLRMARDNLFLELRSAIEEVRSKDTTVRRQGIRVRDEERVRTIDIEVVPVRPPGFDHRGFLVLFEEAEPGRVAPSLATAPSPSTDNEVTLLRQELVDVRAYLNGLVEQHAAASEELKSANEEVLSANEELQSVNEELQTAREELQSNNEELTTVNEELQSRNFETARVSDDLSNTLNSVRIPIVMLGTDLCVRRFTPAAAKVLGLTPADLGRPLDPIHPSFDLPDIDLLAREAIASLTPSEREVQDAQGHWYMLRVLPYRTADNRIDGAVLVLVDIDEVRQTQAQLQEARDFNSAIVDTVREPLLVLDAELRVQRANHSFHEAFNLEPTEIEGRFVYEIADGAYDTPKLRALLEEILPQGSTIEDFELEHEFPHVGRRTLLVNARRLVKEGNHTRQILMAFEDVTERTARIRRLGELTDALREANAAKDLFLAKLSHELRTPLTPVLATVSLLQRDAGLNAQTQEALEMIRRNAELEARLIDDLLDVTRIARGMVELKRRPVALGTIIERAVEVCRPDIEARGLHFDIDLKDPPHGVHADAARLQQVFWNLLRNATKFTPVGGCMGIRCWREGDEVVTEVNDSGMGIEPEVLPNLFRAFEQGSTYTTPGFGGLGLGLAISKAMVELHGGTISAHSQGKGKGATFTVRLPLSDMAIGDGEAKLSTGHPTQAPTATRKLQILFVEDHGDTARVMKKMLELHGHEVQIAGDVATALQLATQRQFQLLISDLGLPDGSGLDLIRELRARGQTLPAIALSGYGQEHDLAESQSVGFAAHLVKPTSFEQLCETIAAFAQ